MPRIFLTGTSTSRGYNTGSGLLSLPARILLQDEDRLLGAYPTISRMGDKDFSGRKKVFFDDTNTVMFGSQSVTYPTALNSLHRFVSGGVATPNKLSDITHNSISRRGIADSHITFSTTENISPFDESRIYIETDSSFYATGTSKSTILDFNTKLSSKSIITIDCNPVIPTSIFFSTGTLPNASGISGGVNSGIAYFNWERKAWEIIGNLTTGSNVDYINNSIHVSSSSMLAIVPGQSVESIIDSPNITNAFGLPQNSFGFPYATKFDATGSQKLSMTSSISLPFVLEKVVFSVSGAFGGPLYGKLIGTAMTDLAITTFVLLRQTDAPIVRTVTSEFSYLNRNPSPDMLIKAVPAWGVTKDCDIVWFCRVGCYNSYSFSTIDVLKQQQPSAFSAADLWIPGGFQTGSFMIESPTKIVAIGPGQSPLITNRTVGIDNIALGHDYTVGNNVGGSNLFEISGGRRIVSNVAGGQLSGTINYLGGISSSKYTEVTKESPYVILPTDKLIFAAIKQLAPGEVSERDVATRDILTLSPGAGKLTFFGTAIRNNKPASMNQNQPLTSNSIHECLSTEDSVYDQFDVESLHVLTGSYVDEIITGSLTNTSDQKSGNVFAGNVRKVQSSIARGQAGTTGSLSRFIKLNSDESTVDGLFLKYYSRRDHVGFLRDDVEPRLQTAAYDSRKNIEYPVQIKFVDRVTHRAVSPDRTHTQNLSPFATSSLPYFDMLTRERPDNPDVSLVPIDIGVI